MVRNRGGGHDEGKGREEITVSVDDPILPVQFWANTKSQRRDPVLPERRLWSAVLKDAFQCCVNGQVSAESSKVRKQEEIESAKAWFLSEETDVGTFLWVCKTLDLDPKRILNRLTGVFERRRMAA